MVVKGFLEVRTYKGGDYVWEDISEYLVSFSSCKEAQRNSITGETAGTSFDVTVNNKNGYWIKPEEINALGKRLADGDDPYGKSLRHRRVRVGIDISSSDGWDRRHWAAGRITGISFQAGNSIVCVLHCESLENEASECKLDTKSAKTSAHGPYGIRGHVIDGSKVETGSSSVAFRDNDYVVYKRRKEYEDSDDHSRLLVCYNSVRINDAITRVGNVMDAKGDSKTIDPVVRKAYKSGTLEPRKALDIVEVVNNDILGSTGDTELRMICGDRNSNIVMLYAKKNSQDTYLVYYDLRNNRYLLADKYKTLTNYKIPEQNEPQIIWYNEYTGTFQWVGVYSSQAFVYEFVPSTETVNSKVLPAQGLCFAQKTPKNSSKGSLFCGSSGLVYEVDVSNLASGASTLYTVTDPLTSAGQEPGWGTAGTEDAAAWGATMTGLSAAISPSAAYFSNKDYRGNNMGTCSNAARGLIVRVTRTVTNTFNWSKGTFEGYIFIDLYNDTGSQAGAGVGFVIWCDNTVRPATTQTYDGAATLHVPFKAIDPDGNQQTILPCLTKAYGSTAETNYTWIKVPNGAWGTHNRSVSSSVSGNGESRFAYYDNTAGRPVVVDAKYEDLTGGKKYSRLYFMANQYYGANGVGKMQSTDGKSLLAENAPSPTRYGDRVFGPYDNAHMTSGLTFTLSTSSSVTVLGAFTIPKEENDEEYLFAYGWDVAYTLPVFDVRDLSIAKLLSDFAQLAGYEWYFNAQGKLSFKDSYKQGQERILTEVSNISFEGGLFEYDKVINKVNISPYEVLMTAGKLNAGNTPPFFKQVNAGSYELRYIVVSESCSEHIKVKVNITKKNSSQVEYTVSEWQDSSQSWVVIGTPVTITTGGDNSFSDPNNKYTIPNAAWDLSGSATNSIGNVFEFWTFEPAAKLEQISEDRFSLEVVDVESQIKYGQSGLEIKNNRFILKTDAETVATRLLKLNRELKKVFILDILDLYTDFQVGELVRFEAPEFWVSFNDKWRIIGITRNPGGSDFSGCSISLKVKET